jgi:hypothetical protein
MLAAITRVSELRGLAGLAAIKISPPLTLS